MTGATAAASTQVFLGVDHRVTFRFQARAEPGGHLVVAFADMLPEPDLAHVDDLAGLDVHRLHVLDDFGVFADEYGYPGCWYLGEHRRLTFEADVMRLTARAIEAAGVSPLNVVAIGHGKGGYAALYYALKHGWGHVVAGSPHSRLGRLLSRDGLAPVAQFIAGGTDRDDLAWLDRLLLEEIDHVTAPPAIHLHAGVRDPGYAEQLLPLTDALDQRGIEFDLTRADHGSEPDQARAAFAAFAFATLGRLTGAPIAGVPFPAPEEAKRSRWNRRTAPRIMSGDDGLRCFVPATPLEGDGHYAGVRLPIDPFHGVIVELSFRRVGELQTILVDALDERGERVHRWRWPVEATWRPVGRERYVLRPGQRFGPFVADEEGEHGSVRALDVFAKARSGTTIDFTVHGIDVVTAEPAISPPGLTLPAEVRAGSRRSVLHTDEELAAHVADLVQRGAFPPPVTPPDGPVARPALKVAGVLDEFSRLGYGYEFAWIDLTPADYAETLDRERPDLLLVESAWRGKDGSWNKLVADADGSNPHEHLRGLVDACRARDIPTVFWNKEDPPNFDVFIGAASLFDHIFTTDESCVPLYRERVAHDRIAALPFAAQPRIHNPVGAPAHRPLDVAFLGTFYARKHADRKRQMEMILDPAREFGLHIYSRVENLRGYEFPLKYQPHLVGTLPYNQVLGAYHHYKVLLNVNSVVGSRTMCARRIFEILGCGGAVVSGPSPAIDHILGPGVVHECAGYVETRDTLAAILDDEIGRERQALAGLRRVLHGHTYGDRVATMLRTLGHKPDEADRSVTVLAIVDGDDAEHAAREAMSRQTHDAATLVLVAEAELEVALRRADTRYVAFLDPAAYYGANYLTDLLGAFRYTEAAIVGKGAHYRHGAQGALMVRDAESRDRYVDAIVPETLVAERAWFGRIGLGSGPWREALLHWQGNAAGAGARIYAADRFNFVAREEGDSSNRLRAEVFGAGGRHVEV